jgi:RNA polymerase sigma factor (sigma-70 family)
MDQSEDRLIFEQSFLTTLRSNNENLLKLLYLEGFGVVKQFVLHNSGSEEDAYDVYQEAYLATWRNVQLSRFSPLDGQAFIAYLVRIAKNKWIDELRRRKKSREGLQKSPGYDDSEVYNEEVDEYIQILKKYYAKLGGRCQDLLGRFYFREQRLSEIAAHFGWTEASAKNNKYRCLKELREYFMKAHNENG